MNLSAWFRDTVSVASVTGKSAYGDPTYGAPRTVAARLESARRLVRSGRGDDLVSNHRLFTTTPIVLSDRVWLPGASTADANASVKPITVESTHDKSGGFSIYMVTL